MIEETLVFVDEGFISRLSKYFGEGNYIKFDKIKFIRELAKKQNLFVKHIFTKNLPRIALSSVWSLILEADVQ